MKNEISIGLLGFGTVGSGVAKIIQQHQEDLQHKLGAKVAIRKVLVRDAGKDRISDLDPNVFTTNIEEILNDSSSI